MEITDKRGYNKSFSLEFVTFDEARKTGGELLRIDKATIVNTNTSFTRIKPGKKLISKPVARKNPNHWDNATRNILVAGSKKIIKVHIWLITKFNKQEVVWNIHG